MASLEERVAQLEAKLLELQQQVTDTHTLAAHADRDVAEFRQELRDQTNLLNLTRLDMSDLRTEMNDRFEQVNDRFEQVNDRFEQVNSQFEQVNGGLAHITSLLGQLIDREGPSDH